MDTDLVDSSGNGLLDTLLHYGLFMGAIFQLICIFAVILVPSKDDEPVRFFKNLTAFFCWPPKSPKLQN